MATLETSIQLIDKVSNPMMNIINSVQRAITTFESLSKTTEKPIELGMIQSTQDELSQTISTIKQMQTEINNISDKSVEIAIEPQINIPTDLEPIKIQIEPQMDANLLDLEPIKPQIDDSLLNAEPIKMPVDLEIPDTITLPEWTNNTIDIFSTTGIERYKQEITDTQNMLGKLASTQASISINSSSKILPDNMTKDIDKAYKKLLDLNKTMQSLSKQKLNSAGADKLNNSIENIRQNLNSAIIAQRGLNSAIKSMDISSANAAYDSMLSSINSVEAGIRNNINSQNKFNSSIDRGSESSNNLLNKIKSIAAAYLGLSGIKKVIDLSDELSQINSRIDLINDGSQTTEQIQDKIFQSAERSRGKYLQTVDAVSKLGMQAGHAFKNTDEIITFTEQLNKTFAIAGTSAVGVDSAMLQLTQSMAAGKLQGEELNAVLDNAQPIVKNIADYMGVPVGEIKELASDGQITAEVLKNAMFAAAEQTNAKFEQMPLTFSQIGNKISNYALKAFEPVLQRINDIANSEGFDTLINGIINGIILIASMATTAFDTLTQVATFVTQNWSMIAPIIYTVVGALLAYKIAAGVVKAATIAMAAAEGIKNTITFISTIATGGLTVAQWGLNGALLACPLTWIVILIIAFIAAIYLGIKALNKFAGTSRSALGVIAGGFFALGAIVYNVIAFLYNLFITFAEFFVNVWHEPLYSVKKLFVSFGNMVLDIVKSLASAIDSVFGSNLAGAVGSLQNRMEKWVSDVPEGYKVLERWEYKSIGDSFKNGYDWGQGVEEGFSLDEFGELPGSGGGQTPDYSYTPYDELEKPVKDTAGNTGAMKDSMDIAEEDLKYLMDLAERDIINRFTTAEIKVEMTNNNSINGDLDLDGVVSYLSDTLYEQMQVAAEGVYN